MRRIPPFHPFLFAAYFVLYSLSANIFQIPLAGQIRPLVAALVLTAGIYLTIYIATKDSLRTGLLTTFVVFLIFYYRHFYSLVIDFPATQFLAGKYVLVFTIWTLVLTPLAGEWLWRRLNLSRVLNRFLNRVSVLAILIPVSSIIFSLYVEKPESSIVDSTHGTSQGEIIRLHPGNRDLPDVYYIVLDGYGRADVLSSIFNYDNSEFIEFLKEKGFYVGERSHSNYIETYLSLTSSLNLVHSADLKTPSGETPSLGRFIQMIRDSRFSNLLHELGYQRFLIENGYLNASAKDADVYFSAYSKTPIRDYEWVLISTSAFGIPINLMHLGEDFPIPGYDSHRSRILYALDRLEEIPKMPGPKFVFVHILGPHPPFVLDEEGKSIQSYRPFYGGDGSEYRGSIEEYSTGYIGEVMYLNRRMAIIIDKILSESAREPVIIIQGDHGPGMLLDWNSPDKSCLWERTSILNAYYFPHSETDQLYPTITPVNSFRIVLNTYFRANLHLLEDKSYYTNDKPPQFIEITDQLNNKENCGIN